MGLLVWRSIEGSGSPRRESCEGIYSIIMWFEVSTQRFFLEVYQRDINYNYSGLKYILCYSHDRFSRSGIGGRWTNAENGISLGRILMELYGAKYPPCDMV
jgi:hypothetical protein